MNNEYEILKTLNAVELWELIGGDNDLLADTAQTEWENRFIATLDPIT